MSYSRWILSHKKEETDQQISAGGVHHHDVQCLAGRVRPQWWDLAGRAVAETDGGAGLGAQRHHLQHSDQGLLWGQYAGTGLQALWGWGWGDSDLIVEDLEVSWLLFGWAKDKWMACSCYLGCEVGYESYQETKWSQHWNRRGGSSAYLEGNEVQHRLGPRWSDFQHPLGRLCSLWLLWSWVWGAAGNLDWNVGWCFLSQFVLVGGFKKFLVSNPTCADLEWLISRGGFKHQCHPMPQCATNNLDVNLYKVI